MSRSEAAAADRLPWLADEPPPKRPTRWRGSLLPLAGVIMMLVAAGAVWVGVRSEESPVPSVGRQAPPSTTLRLPPPATKELPQLVLHTPPQVQPSPQPQVPPSPVREVHVPAGHAVTVGSETNAASTPAPPKGQAEVAPVQSHEDISGLPRPWDPRLLRGASGRIVQVGAFGSTRQAKHGWWYMVRAYPAVAHLPAVVRTSRNSKGRTFFRFQVGTTSQAHSEILCQRMERIGLSCAVVGLPWKAKVER